MKIGVATVLDPDNRKRYQKAKATMEADRLVVTDRRNRILLEVEAPQETISDDHWRYGSVRVERAHGCGCGGTKIESM